MCELNQFLNVNPLSQQIKMFDDKDMLELSKYKVPTDIINFLQTQGLSSYRANFFWTTLPQHNFQVLSEWGLNGKKCFTFLKTAFGSLCYYYNGKIFQLDPLTGNSIESSFQFCKFMNIVMIQPDIIESFYFDIYQNISNNEILKPDEIFALVPALPLGGSFETSNFEVVKIQEHLAFLAQLFNNKAKIL